MTQRGRRWRWLAAVGLLALVAAAAGSVGWAATGPGPEPAALTALESDATVQVETRSGWLVFRPAGAAQPETGLVFYPGARVEARAYAPAARAIAAAGYQVVIVPMPLRVAVLGVGRASAVMTAFPEVTAWAVGGHSLGGAMAAQFVSANPGAARGLVLWAAYPPEGADLSALPLAVVSVYGTADGLARPEEVRAAAGRLPAETAWVAIEGGNHAQFGRYGAQAGDDPATITPEAQQAQGVAATVALLAALTPAR